MMKTYYTAKHAERYNHIWHTFLRKTLAATLSVLDVAALQQKAEAHEHSLRILDVACGTGVLLEQLHHLFPYAELYGVDASQTMLAQAARLLHDHPTVHLVQATAGSGETAGLPYPSAFFDLVTCTNTLHYFLDPGTTLNGFKHLLAPGGQMVLEDYVLRGPPFPWRAFEWVIKAKDPQHQRIYTQKEAQTLCQNAGFLVTNAYSFPIDLFCQGWILHNVLS